MRTHRAKRELESNRQSSRALILMLADHLGTNENLQNTFASAPLIGNIMASSP
jgi:hypothetical protein